MTTSTTPPLSPAVIPTAPKVGSFGDLEPPRLVALRPNLCMACFSLMKVRPATFILNQAEARGELEPGGTICESSSGTFGLALAMLGRARGYRVRSVSSPLSVDQRLLSRLERLGATVEFVYDPAPVGGSQQARLDHRTLALQVPLITVPMIRSRARTSATPNRPEQHISERGRHDGLATGSDRNRGL